MPTVTSSTPVRLLDQHGHEEWRGTLSEWEAKNNEYDLLVSVRADLAAEGIHAGGGGAEPFWTLELAPLATTVTICPHGSTAQPFVGDVKAVRRALALATDRALEHDAALSVIGPDGEYLTVASIASLVHPRPVAAMSGFIAQHVRSRKSAA